MRCRTGVFCLALWLVFGAPVLAVHDRPMTENTPAIWLELLRRGNSSYQRRDFDQAIAEYDTAIRLNPRNASAFIGRADAHFSKNNFDQAIADYDEAIRLDPQQSSAFSGRGFAYLLKGDAKRAIADQDEAIRLSPKNAGAFVLRALGHIAHRDYDRAIADCDTAVSLDPTRDLAFLLRGYGYQETRDYDRAVADYSETILLHPKGALAFYLRGLAYAEKNDYDRAIADLARAVQFSRDAYAVVLHYLARARLRQANATAELEANAAQLRQPDWPYPIVEMFLGRRSVQATLETASTPDQRCEAQFYVGEWHLLQGQESAALPFFRTATDTCPIDFLEFTGAEAELKRLGR